MPDAGQQASGLAAPLRAETVTAICEHSPVLRIVSRCRMIMVKGQQQKIGGDRTMLIGWETESEPMVVAVIAATMDTQDAGIQ